MFPVVRNNVYDVFQLLDYPDAAVPNGDRPTTTIAPQALMMMNSDFVEQCSANFASLLFNDGLRKKQRCQEPQRVRIDILEIENLLKKTISACFSIIDGRPETIGKPTRSRR